ncbi:MAG TPA: AI-2E family transporter [Pyrinomonadaceae bacterium]|jgi:predicted PurR-regulated permease PerM|nr:AI-2E family transporter [Pyrinomonadaceae bacterium]
MANPIFTQKILTTTAIVVFVVLAILLVVYAVDALLLVFAAILLAVFFRGMADWLSDHTGLGQRLSFAIVIITTLLTLGVSLYFLEQSIVEQVRELREQLPQSINSLRGRLEQTGWGRTILEQIPSTTQEVRDTAQNANLTTHATGILSSTVRFFGDFFVFLVLGIFLAVEPKTYIRGAVKLLPVSRRKRGGEVLNAIGETLRWWLVGKFGSMLAVGVLTYIGLWFLDIPLALTLSIITALLTFIPNIGPVLSVLPAALLALSQDPIKALYVVLLYIIVQIIESNLITPWIERETIELPPALTIIVQVVLSVFVGALGLVLATPLLAVGLVLVQMLYIEDVLGDNLDTPDEKQANSTTEDAEDTEKN